MFVSEAFEGSSKASISDNDIVKKSGFLDKLDAGDRIYNKRHAVCETSRCEHPTFSSRKDQTNSGRRNYN